MATPLDNFDQALVFDFHDGLQTSFAHAFDFLLRATKNKFKEFKLLLTVSGRPLKFILFFFSECPALFNLGKERLPP
jgi:hypothetical protein